jgi:hypothetical protein
MRKLFIEAEMNESFSYVDISFGPSPLDAIIDSFSLYFIASYASHQSFVLMFFLTKFSFHSCSEFFLPSIVEKAEPKIDMSTEPLRVMEEKSELKVDYLYPVIYTQQERHRGH